MKTIGEIVEEDRKKMMLTQAQLANYTNVSTKFVIGLEGGKKTIQMDKPFRVFNVFDLTILIVSKKDISR